VFHLGAVEELSDEPETVAAALPALEAKELVRPEEADVAGGLAFRFRHLLIRDAAYRGLPKRLRAMLHRRYARWLERVVGGRATEYGELLGYHLEQAYRYRAELGPIDAETRELGAEAATWLSSAASRAFVRGDMRAAANLLGRAVRLYERDTPERLELLPELARALRYSGDARGAAAVLREAVDAAAALGDDRLEARVAIESAFLTLYTDSEAEATEAVRIAEQAAAVFAGREDELGLAKSWILIGVANWHLCRGAAMEEAFDRALSHLRRSGDLRERWWIVTKLLECVVFGPTPVEAGIRRCDELLALGDGMRSLETSAAAAVASLQAMRGNFTTARELYASSKAIAEELGLSQWLGSLGNFVGPIELLADDPAAAERALRQGYEALESLGETGVLSTTAANLSRAIALQGRYEEAEHFAGVSRRAASRDDLYSQVVWRGTSARVLIHRGDLSAAEALAREAVELMTVSDFLNLRGESLLDLAEVLRAGGQDARATEATREALGLFEAKGCIVLAERARALLDRAPGLAVGS
jgi:tetratricopeptide (TPR) repeat protein